MSFQKIKSYSYCVGGRQKSARKNIYGDIISKGSKVLIGYCSVCNRRKSMTVSDNTIQAEGLGDFSKSLGKKGLNVSKLAKKNVLGNPGRALEIGANVGNAIASRNPKEALSSLPKVSTFITPEKDFA